MSDKAYSYSSVVCTVCVGVQACKIMILYIIVLIINYFFHFISFIFHFICFILFIFMLFFLISFHILFFDISDEATITCTVVCMCVQSCRIKILYITVLLINYDLFCYFMAFLFHIFTCDEATIFHTVVTYLRVPHTRWFFCRVQMDWYISLKTQRQWWIEHHRQVHRSSVRCYF